MKFLNLKFIISLLLVFVVIFISKTSFVHADAIDELVINPANSLLELILKGLSWMLAFLGTLVDDVMQPQSILQADIVKTGWRITRDFANMFFILILLAIALSFILFPRFQIKQALPRLLLIALLINFSLPIAGIFIDFANIFTKYFLDQAATGGNISELIASQLNITAIRDVSEQALTANIGNTPGQIFLSLLFGIVFVSVVIFIFIALAFMFLIRNIYLYILLIILPLALVASILPSGRSYFSQWSHKFFQWTFFAPIATFFIFLSMVSFSSIIKADAAPLATDAGVGFLAGTYDYIIILLLLMGSLFAANSLGVQTAGVTNRMMKYGGKALRGGIGKPGKRIGGMAARQAKIPEGMGYLAKATRYIPNVIGGAYATRALTGGATALKSGKTKRAELSETDKKLAEKMSDSDLITSMKAGGPKAHSYAAVLAKRGKLNEEDAEKMLIKAEKFGSKEDSQAIIVSNPLAATKVRESQINKESDVEKLKKQYNIVGGSDSNVRKKAKEKAEERIWKSIKPSDIEKIDPEILQGEKGIKYINKLRKHSRQNYSQHIRAASKSGNTAFLEAEERSLKNMDLKDAQAMEKSNPELIKWYNSAGSIGIASLPEEFNSKLNTSNKRKEIADQIRDLRKQGAKTPEDRKALKELTEELKRTTL